MLETPILITAFNRPKETQQVFDAIKIAKPKYLFVCIDGARDKNVNEQQKVKETQAIFDQIDWDCNLKTLFQATNLGCKRSVSSGIDWFFKHVESGIILEDDCIPSQEFLFRTQELLLKFKNNDEVFMIGGNNMLSSETQHLPHSYFFTPFPFIWGWATWRRSWITRDLEISDLDHFVSSKKMNHLHITNASKNYLLDKFISVKNGTLDSWAYGWFYTVMKHQGLSILFSKNQTENIGFGDQSTHTKGNTHHYTAIEKMDPSFIHPEVIIADHTFDQKFFYKAQKSKHELVANQLLPKPMISFLKKIIKRD